MNLPYKETADGIVVEVKVEPRSSKKGIAGVMGNVIKVRLTAPPVEGEANEQLKEILAERFRVRRSDITILRGRSSRLKTLRIGGVKS
ncbi:MAG: DUF167 domain-containing protein [Nitrospirae bacterium]|nr:DUF167 domain-containing protein [Nitrospirota bacterium]